MGKNKTERLYYDYASAAPYGAEIVEVRSMEGGAGIFLDKTIFYPEGGGQPADRGTVNGARLLDVREKDGEIVHLVSVQDAGTLKPGKAELRLDYRRRRDFTALHTGQHLLSAVILRMTGAPTVSMHLGDKTCTIDVQAAELSGESLVAVEEAAADAIEENHPVIIHLCPPEDASSFPLRKIPPSGEEVIRVVEIEGSDFSPCCGTHLASTAEIGMLRILRAEKYKGMTRVTFIAGRRVLLDSRLLRQNADIVSRSLKVPVHETGKAVLDFLEKTARIEKNLKTREEEAAELKAKELLRKINASDGSSARLFIESYSGAGIDEALCIGRAAGKQTEAPFILVSEKDIKFAAFCSAKDFDLRSLIKGALDAHGGRGGGSPSFFQGSFGTKEALSAFLTALNN